MILLEDKGERPEEQIEDSQQNRTQYAEVETLGTTLAHQSPSQATTAHPPLARRRAVETAVCTTRVRSWGSTSTSSRLALSILGYPSPRASERPFDGAALGGMSQVQRRRSRQASARLALTFRVRVLHSDLSRGPYYENVETPMHTISHTASSGPLLQDQRVMRGQEQ